MSYLVQFIAVFAVLMIAPSVVKGVRVRDTNAAIVGAIIFALLAIVVGTVLTKVLSILALPLTIVTLGAFQLVVMWTVNAIILKMTAGLMDSFHIRDWKAAFMLSLLYSLAVFIIGSVL